MRDEGPRSTPKPSLEAKPSTVLQAVAIGSFVLNILCVGLFVLMAKSIAGPPGGGGSGDVEASRFILRDANGKSRAVLGMSESGQPALVFWGGQQGTVTVGFQDAQTDFPTITLVDGQGRKRLGLGAELDGSYVTVYDRRGEPVGELSQFQDGGGTMVLNKPGTEGRVQGGVFATGEVEFLVTSSKGEHLQDVTDLKPAR